MKKIGKAVWSFLKSMRFGMVLLFLIAVLSMAGTLISQGQGAAYYTETYGAALGNAITFAGLDHIYSAPVYAVLYALLCINLVFCSLLRIGRLPGMGKRLCDAAMRAEPAVPERCEAWLAKNGFRKCGEGRWLRSRLGLYGSFITHLGILLLVVGAACMFSLEKKSDLTLLVGQPGELEDGTKVTADSFQIQDQNGRVDYVSQLTIVRRGTEMHKTLQVNHPVRLGNISLYQAAYNFAGALDVRTSVDGEDERAVLDSPAFISLDGQNGVAYMGSFGNFIRTADDQLLPEGTDGAEGEKVTGYMIGVINGDSQKTQIALTDQTFEVAGVWYTFRNPETYPVLTVKTVPGWVYPILYVSFVLLLLGLWLCFFHAPMAAYAGEGGTALFGTKELAAWTEKLKDDLAEEKEKENPSC